ncbi:MAG: trans-sulfuration enzyme family protein [Actinomycetales bacterium]
MAPPNDSPTDHSQLAAATRLVTLGRPLRAEGAPVGPPIQLTSTFVGAGPIPDPHGHPGYGRPDNETVGLLESVLASLEGTADRPATATVFSSGMAAISAVLSDLPTGARVLSAHSAYNTTLELLTDLAARGRIELIRQDVSDTQACREALLSRAPVDLVWLESPTNPLLDIADIAAISSAAHQVGATVVVDNTFATALIQQPLTLGADVVVYSVTKFLSGHSDVLLGAVLTADDAVAQDISRHRRVHGAIAGPFEAWLALRGLRTLDVRLHRQQETAQRLAQWLDGHRAVRLVRYPGLPAHPGHETARRQMRGFGAMLAADLDADARTAEQAVRACRLWVPATSLGGVESLIERRRRIASEAEAVPEALLRFSVGIEAADDLIADLDAAFSVLD